MTSAMSPADWDAVFRLLQQKDRTLIYEQFVSILKVHLAERHDVAELVPLADRAYVGDCTHRIETETDSLLRGVGPRFAAIRDSLPDLRSSVDQIHSQFRNQAELFKADLIKIRDALAAEHRALLAAKVPTRPIPVDQIVPRGIRGGDVSKPVYRTSRRKRVPPLPPVIDDWEINGGRLRYIPNSPAVDQWQTYQSS
jgi:hypothetical protein